MKKKIAVLAVFTLIFLVVGVSYFNGFEKDDEENITVLTVLNDEVQNSKENTEAVADVVSRDKTETVYAKADGNGNIKTVTVESCLKKNLSDSSIKDRTILENIKNKQGDEEYIIDEDGNLQWENKGESINYEGTTNKSLPVDVKITYYLDGVLTAAEDMAGVSGNVKIRFDYTNKTARNVSAYGSYTKVCVPFAVISAVTFDSEKFYNVQVKNGDAFESEQQTIAIGYAFPGLEQSLNLSSYDFADDIGDIPDYVEITAYTTDFQLEFTATVITSGMFSDIKDSDLNKVNDIVSDIEQLTSSSDDMKAATGKLYDGADKLSTLLETYTRGADAVSQWSVNALNVFTDVNGLNKDIDDIFTALSDLNTEIGKINISQIDSETLNLLKDTTEKISNLSQSLQAVKDYVEKVRNIENAISSISLQQTKDDIYDSVEQALPTDLDESVKEYILNNIDYDNCVADINRQLENIKNLLNDSSAVYPTQAVADLTDNIAKVESNIKILAQKNDNLQSVATALSDCTAQLNSLSLQIQRLATNTRNMSQKIDTLTQQSNEISNTAGKVQQYSAYINDGIKAMVEGTKAFDSAMKKFTDDNLSQLTETSNDIVDLQRRIKALKTADKNYDNFSGKIKGQSSSVTFIIETEKIG